jgi:hypothetical protein
MYRRLFVAGAFPLVHRPGFSLMHRVITGAGSTLCAVSAPAPVAAFMAAPGSALHADLT